MANFLSGIKNINAFLEWTKQYWSLLKTLLKSSFSLGKLNKQREKPLTGIKKILGTAGVILLLIVGGIGILLYMITTSWELTLTAINQNAVMELQYAFIAFVQIAVLFFGLASLLGNLYFAKDNTMLLSLPFKKGVVFSAKFTVTYLSELFFATIFYIPLVITSGVVLLLEGLVGVTFFICAIVALIMIPFVPLLIATVLAEPLMLVTSLLKKKAVANTVVMGVVYAGVFALYFALIMGTSIREEDGSLPLGIIGALQGIKTATIFNYPLVESLFNQRPLLNIFIYFVGVLVVFASTALLSMFFYNKTLSRIGEGDGKGKKQVKKGETKAQSFLKSFLIKDVKNIITHPSLLINIVLMAIMPIIVVVFLGFSLNNGTFGEDLEGLQPNNFLVVIITYITNLMICAGNPIANIGFSLEGKNLLVLKSYPIDVKEIIKAKFILASSITAVIGIILLISFPIASGVTNAVAIIGLPLLCCVSGLAYTAMGLLNDLKRPNYSWTNLNEITRNNVRNFKPMILFLALSFVYLILGIFLVVFGSALGVSEYITFSVYYLLCLVAPVTIFIVYYKRLQNAKDLFEAIGG